MAFTIKKGDTLPDIQASLTSGVSAGAQSPVDLTTATSIILVLKSSQGGGAASRKTGSVVGTPTNGVVKYVWQVSDTATSGTFNAEWEVTFAAGKIQSFPNDSYFQIIIFDDLG